MRHITRGFVTKGLLLINAGIFGFYAVAALSSPRWFAGLLDISLLSSTGAADFRSMYGGLCLASACLFARGLRDPEWTRPALVLATLSSVGLLLGRVITLLSEERPRAIIFIFLASEVAGVAVGAWLLSPATTAPNNSRAAAQS